MTQSCGLVAVVGAPNAGKSTLVNALVGQKVAIVSPKAQTTRTRLMGIAIHGESNGAYGAPRIHGALRERAGHCGRARVGQADGVSLRGRAGAGGGGRRTPTPTPRPGP